MFYSEQLIAVTWSISSTSIGYCCACLQPGRVSFSVIIDQIVTHSGHGHGEDGVWPEWSFKGATVFYLDLTGSFCCDFEFSYLVLQRGGVIINY